MTEEERAELAEQEQAKAPPEPEPEAPAPKTRMDPVRRWTLITSAVIGLLLVWYLAADRFTPFTSQARVKAYVVPVASEVSGTVTEVDIGDNQFVDAGERLFQIDRTRIALAVERAEADLQVAREALGAASAGVDAAEASLQSANANLKKADQDATRLKRIYEEDPGAISERRLEIAEATLSQAQSGVAGAQAQLQQTRQQRGEREEQILIARSALEQTQVDLDRTRVVAPERGLITDVAVNAGNFAQAGKPLMTFIAIHDLWVQADMTENNLGHLDPGDVVDVVLDVQPGRVLRGKVRSIGYGVASGGSVLGGLPTIENDRNWLREAQRFPVIIDFDPAIHREGIGWRVGSQADVIVYSGDHTFLNLLGRVYIRIVSWLTYAY
jgi:multidrug resistance efflux pump